MRIDYCCNIIFSGLRMTAYLVVGAGRRIPKGTMDFVEPDRPALTSAIEAELTTNPLLL